ncbi:unnamed protein product [Paramecium pentaurelia]|uniref:Uncharacterized protein n=1 Tax=Paramecium pentaurelia TaxID=43138 RepID=A0A8S1XZN1_9CILI|nr:unnamed protein product [Paramecium pentaurelia]CAD8205868.1 unnamed protein product [Paramecium pentaurelia]
MQKEIAYDKAIYLMVQPTKQENGNELLLNELSNQNTFIINWKLGLARLCPLNKCQPEIPINDQFRLLVIMSRYSNFWNFVFKINYKITQKKKNYKPLTEFISGNDSIFLLLNWSKQLNRKNQLFNITQISLVLIRRLIDKDYIKYQKKEIRQKQKILSIQKLFTAEYSMQILQFIKQNLFQKWCSSRVTNITCPIQHYFDEFLKNLIQETKILLSFLLNNIHEISAQWNLRINTKKKVTSCKQNTKLNAKLYVNSLLFQVTNIQGQSQIMKELFSIICEKSSIQDKLFQQLTLLHIQNYRIFTKSISLQNVY